jgi:hypothetical protein
MRTRTTRTRFAALAFSIAVAGLAAATAVTSSRAAGTASFCPPAGAVATPFLPWGDQSSYALAPDGGLEGGGVGWMLAGGAAVVSGNESYHVHGAADHRMLYLPAGASATTPPLCVDSSVPTMRFFVARAAGFGSRLSVEALYADPGGTSAWHPLGTVASAGFGWQPSRVLRLPTRIQSPSVRFRFSVSRGAGGYRLDDLYVDPYIRV